MHSGSWVCLVFFNAAFRFKSLKRNHEEFFEHALVSEMQLRLSAWAEQEPREGLQVHGILFGPAKAAQRGDRSEHRL